MIYVSRIYTLLIFVGFFDWLVDATYDQSDESLYIENFDSITADSYSAIDDDIAPERLLEECKNTAHVSNPMEEIVVKAPSGGTLVSSSSVSLQCGLDSKCIIPAGVAVTMDSSLNVASLVIRGSIIWNDRTQNKNIHQWLCAGYVAVGKYYYLLFCVFREWYFKETLTF